MERTKQIMFISVAHQFNICFKHFVTRYGFRLPTAYSYRLDGGWLVLFNMFDDAFV